MKRLFFHFPENMSPQARSAFQIAVAIASAHFVAVPYYLYLIYRGQTTITALFITLTAITVMLSVLFGIGAMLSWRGKPAPGILLALGVLAVSYRPLSVYRENHETNYLLTFKTTT